MHKVGKIASSKDGISALIRREMRTETNARFLRNMPIFRTETTLPDEMEALLGALDEAERRR